jgi:hypothetical protein
MGLLDDAIREHLELKRQHGGDPSEIERQEREAFGPAMRRAEADEGEAGAPQVGEDATSAVEPAPAADARPAPLAEDELTRQEPPAVEDRGPATAEQPVADEIPPPVDEETPRRGHEGAAPGYDEDPWLEVDDEPPPPEDAARAEDAAPAAEEDVLEETPEFLQETPEHERLWFEQKPPRDFDWDK